MNATEAFNQEWTSRLKHEDLDGLIRGLQEIQTILKEEV